MEIPLHSQFDSRHWMCTVYFDVQAFFAYASTGTPRLGVPALFQRAQHENQAQQLFPVLLEVHGSLSGPTSPGESGMPLLAVKEVPIHLLHGTSGLEHILVYLEHTFISLFLKALLSQAFL